MQSRLFSNDSDISLMKQLIASFPDKISLVDFEEMVQLKAVQDSTRLWFENDRLVAFAFVDEWNNLGFEIQPEFVTVSLEQEVLAWGINRVEKQNATQTGELTLDCSCASDNLMRVSFLERYGFELSPIQSLHYTRDLSEPILPHQSPPGFHIRLAGGENEINELVALHRAAFGTENMTVEYRQAIMSAPQYAADMDWVIVSQDDNLAGFCLGGVEGPGSRVGYLDPVGVHPKYWQKGLGTALLSHGLSELKKRGIKTVELGTSSENIAMQKLAGKAGFILSAKSLWYSLKIR